MPKKMPAKSDSAITEKPDFVPQKVWDEFTASLDKDCAEMIRAFDAHAKEYEERTGDKGEPLLKAPQAKANRKGTARRKSPKA